MCVARNPKDEVVSYFMLLEDLAFDNLSGIFEEFLWKFYLGKVEVFVDVLKINLAGDQFMVFQIPSKYLFFFGRGHI